MKKRMTSIHDFKKYKSEGTKIAMCTCYDYTSARLVERSDVDCVLVGDSLGMVIAGFDSTVPVTLEQMSYHTRCVKRGAGTMFIIADMPFLSYHVSVEKAVASAGELLQSGAHSVKLEGGLPFADTVKRLTDCSIPVCGHLGMTPQSINAFGGFKIQGRGDEAAKKLIEDALALEEAGAFSIVLELVPEALADEISRKLSIPTIGIGAGRYCDGQVLVINDILGLDDSFNPRMVKKYMNGAASIIDSLNSYSAEVKEGVFPSKQHIFS